MKYFGVAISSVLAFSLAACTPASQHLKQVRGERTNNISAGKVQREIKVGMPSSDVVQALGSPNVVSLDDQRREVWVYDKISTEEAHQSTAGGFSLILLGYGKDTSARATNQRTLTVIVKFDQDSRVRDFSYHQSSF